MPYTMFEEDVWCLLELVPMTTLEQPPLSCLIKAPSRLRRATLRSHPQSPSVWIGPYLQRRDRGEMRVEVIDVSECQKQGEE